MRQVVRPLVVASAIVVAAASGCTPAAEESATGDARPPSTGSVVEQVVAVAMTAGANDLGYREVDLGDGHQLVLVPAGSFPMGSEEGLDPDVG